MYNKESKIVKKAIETMGKSIESRYYPVTIVDIEPLSESLISKESKVNHVIDEVTREYGYNESRIVILLWEGYKAPEIQKKLGVKNYEITETRKKLYKDLKKRIEENSR